MTAVSLRAAAGALGVSHQALSKGIVTGRLRRSIGRDVAGRPFVKDLELARREWAAAGGKPLPSAGLTEDEGVELAFRAVAYVTTGPGREAARYREDDPEAVDGRALLQWLREQTQEWKP